MANLNSNAAIDLGQLFGAVAKTMTENQGTLNNADTYNHDHGDNMVQIFNTITQAIQQTPNAPAATQLSNASAALARNTSSGSGKLYAEGLKNAAAQFQGTQSLTANDIMRLIQLLLGSSAGAAAQTGTGTDTSAGGDLIGSILGGLEGAGTQGAAGATGTADSQIDLGDILNAGMAFIEAKQAVKSGLDAALSAIVGNSAHANQEYRSQSATMVANAVINAVTKMTQAKQ